MSFVQLKNPLEEHQATVLALKAADTERASEIKRLGRVTGATEQKLSEINTKLDSVEEQITGLETALQRKAKLITVDQKHYNTHQIVHKHAFVQFLRKGNEAGLRELEAKEQDHIETLPLPKHMS